VKLLMGVGARRIALETVPLAVVLSVPIAPGPAGFSSVEGAGACAADILEAFVWTPFALAPLVGAGIPGFISESSLSSVLRC